MGKKSRPTFKKRQKELARQQKQQSKQAQRRAKSELKGDKVPNAEGEDPDIGGPARAPSPCPPSGSPSRRVTIRTTPPGTTGSTRRDRLSADPA